MADGSYGERSIFIDLTVTGARVIKDATKNEFVKISSIHIYGVTGAGSGAIVLHKESASGPTIFQISPANGATVSIEKEFSEKVPIHKGLYMDALGTAWTAGASMQIDIA